MDAADRDGCRRGRRVISPVEGDSSPPSIFLYSPKRDPGTIIEIDDIDDLKDETISTLDFIVRPRSETATTLVIEGTIELTSSGWIGTDYTLTGQLKLKYPKLRQE